MNEEQIINLDNIPNTWGIATLNEMASDEKNAIKRGPFGSAIKKSFFVPIGYKVYEQQHVIYNDFKRGNYFIPEDKYKELESFRVKTGDILMSCSGTVGRLAIVPDDHEQGIINQALLKISLDNDVIDTLFFTYLFGFNVNRILLKSTRGSAMLNISSVRDLKKIHFPLPPLPEQNRIVDKIEELLTRLDAGVEALKQTQVLLKRYRQSVLKAAVEGRLTAEWRKKHKDEIESSDKLLERILKERREKWEAEQLANYMAKGKKPPKNWQSKYKEPLPPDTTALPELPEGWAWATFEQIGEWRGGGTPSKRNPDYWTNGDIPWVSPKDMKVNYIENTKDSITSNAVNDSATKLIPKDSLLFVTRSGILRHTLPVAINKLEVTVNQDLKALTLTKYVDSRFPLIFSIANNRDILHSCSKDGTTVQSIESPQLYIYPIPIPPIKEQLKIIEEVERLSSIIERTEIIAESELKRSQSLRQSILKRAFEGKLVPQDPDDEPASVLLERINAEKV